MNQMMQEYYPIFTQYQAMRNQMMDMLSDEDLQFRVKGNESLGELCKTIGETEHAYIQSFKDFKIDFSYKHPDKEIGSSVANLKDWYKEMDEQLQTILEGFTDEGLQKPVDRGGWTLPVRINLTVYTEALLIFYGKARVYLQAMGKELPEQWQQWIA